VIEDEPKPTNHTPFTDDGKPLRVSNNPAEEFGGVESLAAAIERLKIGSHMKTASFMQSLELIRVRDTKPIETPEIPHIDGQQLGDAMNVHTGSKPCIMNLHAMNIVRNQ
jgi:hypothetical protein